MFPVQTTIVWDPVPGATSYGVTVQKDADAPVAGPDVTAPQSDFDVPGPGMYTATITPKAGLQTGPAGIGIASFVELTAPVNVHFVIRQP
jgi:hypothetical protein